MSRPGPYQGEPGRRPHGYPQRYPRQQDPYGQPPSRGPVAPVRDDRGGRPGRLPGLGLLLTLLGLVVQALSLLVLPWLTPPPATSR